VSDWDDWLGRSTSTTAFLDPAQANRMAATLDRAPQFVTGDDVPPAWHWLYFHDVVPVSQLGADGHPRLGLTMPPVPFERRMWAGGRISFEEPLTLGETATRTSTIRAITPRAGRTGPLVFVTVDHETKVDDRRSLLEEQTLVYRGPATGSGPSGAGAAAPTDAEVSEQRRFDGATLFRYSALTFNSHRIHYDADYAREVEGYRDLVVHGPLLATLLADLAGRQGDRLATFDYKAVSPLFVSEAFTVNRRCRGEGAALWAASSDGRLAMDASVAYRQEI